MTPYGASSRPPASRTSCETPSASTAHERSNTEEDHRKGTPMSDSTLAYAVRTATRQGVTRDLPHGPEDLQWVANSATLIYSDQDAVLVDTYTSIEQNAELVQWVRSFGKRLTYIYITHGHGDHFFGIGQLQEAFPEARAVASHGTVAVAPIQGGPQYREEFWEKLFPGQIPEIAYPEPLGAGFFELEGHRLEVIEAGFTRHRRHHQPAGARPPPDRRRRRGLQRHPPVHRRDNHRDPGALGAGRRAARRAPPGSSDRRTQEARRRRRPGHPRPDGGLPARLQQGRRRDRHGRGALRPDARALPASGQPRRAMGRVEDREARAQLSNTPRPGTGDGHEARTDGFGSTAPGGRGGAAGS